MLQIGCKAGMVIIWGKVDRQVSQELIHTILLPHIGSLRAAAWEMGKFSDGVTCNQLAKLRRWVRFAKIHFGNQSLKAIGHSFQIYHVPWSTDAL